MLLGVDDSLGRIVAALARKGILDDTIVVFTSDHGYFYGEHGLNEERRLAYEETIRIPLHRALSAAGPARARRRRRWPSASTWRRRCSTLAGVAPPAGIQGRSLVPLLDADGEGLAVGLPRRVLQRHRVSAHPEHGLLRRCGRRGTSTSSTGS